MALTLPPNAGAERDEAILAYIRAGNYSANLYPVESEFNGHRATFYVFQDALKIEGVRINVSARLQQVIADLLGCSLMTAKIADLAWMQRQTSLSPFPRGNTNGMDTTQAMLDHSKKIDDALARFTIQPTGIIQTVGKHWILDNDLDPNKLIYGVHAACNYGWHFVGSSYQGITGEVTASQVKDDKGQFVRLIQGRGFAHNMAEVDYSQVCVLMSQMVDVDGGSAELGAVLTDPALAGLANHKGRMTNLRQPGVPVTPMHEMLFPVIQITVTPGETENT